MARTKPAPMSSKDVRSCFVIMPFGMKRAEDRKTRIDFNRIYRTIIKPGVESLRRERERINIKCVRSDEIRRAGLIHERMIQQIAEADVAVVDLTTANPNVYYELGVRHALRDRVTVLLRQKGKPNPFNIAGMSTIEYETDKKGRARAREAIATYVRAGLMSGSKDSLVYTVLPGVGAPREIQQSEVEEYFAEHLKGKIIGIVAGNLRHANLNAKLFDRPIDIWVNSENINMQMARPYDASVSGLIRYLGARKDKTGTIVDDVIADELKDLMGERQVVNPGQIVPTSSGELAKTHHVKRVFHAASVYGVVGVGFRTIDGVEQCITHALALIDFEKKLDPERKQAASASQTESILFPLIGVGTARADITSSARKLVASAVSYLRSRAGFTEVKRVYFMARTEAERAALRVIFAELQLRRLPAGRASTTAGQAPRRKTRHTKRSR